MSSENKTVNVTLSFEIEIQPEDLEEFADMDDDGDGMCGRDLVIHGYLESWFSCDEYGKKDGRQYVSYHGLECEESE